MLMPSLKSVIVHDGLANEIWASDDWDRGNEVELARDAISNALTDSAEFAGVIRMEADRVLYSFAIRSDQVDLVGVVTLEAKLSGTRTEARPLPYVRQLLLPAL